MIRIACLLDRKDGIVPGLFNEAEHAVVIDAESGSILMELDRGKMSDTEFARAVAETGVEAVITGEIEQDPFEIIADQFGITRYRGTGYRTGEAVELMNAWRLPVIPDFIGGTGCHSGGECHGHGH